MTRIVYTVPVPCEFTKGEYRALARIATNKGTQVHTLIEAMVSRALRTAVVPDTLRGPQVRKPKRQTTSVDIDRLKALHTEGLNDLEIAAAMGFSRQWVGQKRREELKLPPNHRKERAA